MGLREIIPALFFAIFSAGALGLAQEPANPVPQGADPQAGSQRYSVAGSVVNAATGEPVPRALVQLNANPQRTAFTGPDGRFEFQGVPAGVAIVTASKPGFFTPQEIGLSQPGNAYPLIQIGRESTGDIKVTLMPSGSIAGHVTNANGEPVEGIQVRALYHQLLDGRYRWEDRGSANTDDNGMYRISGLIPGQYSVATVSRTTHQLGQADRAPNQGYDPVYPAVYYPGSADLSSAAPLQVAAGESIQADFALTPQRGYRITGTVAGISLERSSFTLLDRDGNQTFAPVQSDARTNQFRFSNVLPGDYTIRVTSFGGPNQWAYGVAQVGVSGADVDNVAVDASPAFTIPIEIDREGSSQPAAGPPTIVQFSGPQRITSVRLVAKDANVLIPEIHSQPAAGQNQGEQALVNVLPGRYHVEVDQVANGYVASVRSGGTDLIQQDLLVTSGAQPAPIQVTIHGGGASIKGTVKKGDSAVAQASVLVLPDNPSPAMSIVAARAGTFTVQGLAPGAYHVYAFPSLGGIEYRNPEAMRKYEQQAAAVSLSDNDAKQIEVEVITGTQP
jgi:hypothetical protein